MDSFIQAAFEQVCKDAVQPTTTSVALMCRAPYYGGPEEGGWWGEDVNCVAYQQFDTEAEAHAAANAVELLAAEMSKDAQTQYGLQCLTEMEMLDRKGLDADYLPEPDGPEEFYVLVCDGYPQSYRGSRCYS